MMEEVLTHTNSTLTSDNTSINKMPSDVRPAIHVARKVCQEIHARIRNNKYDVFHSKIQVPFYRKIEIIAKEITFLQLLRIISIDLLFLVMYNASWLFVLAWACFTTSTHIDSPTYLQFHIIHTIPVFVWTFPPRRVLRDACILSCIAITYTTPWDNLLVYMSGWSYVEGRVFQVLGYVPVEEYAFFLIETFIVCGTFTLMAGDTEFRSVPRSLPRCSILVGGLSVTVIGWWMSTYRFYLGSIFVWCAPPITFQLWYRVEVVLKHKWLVMRCALVTTLYLCIIDHWGMKHGTWTIEDTFFDVYPGLPVEEMLFFVVTSIMCCQGFLMSLCLLTEFMDAVRSLNFLQPIRKWIVQW